MKSWTILKAYFVVYLTCCIVFIIVNWKALSSEIVNWNNLSFQEGWGITYIIVFIFIGVTGLITDYILTKIIMNKRILNGIEILIAIVFSIVLLIELV